MSRIAVAASVILSIALFTHAIPAATPTSRPAASQPAKLATLTLAQHVRTKSTAILDALVADADFTAASNKIDALFDQAIAHVSDKSLDALREAAFTRRFVHQLADLPEASRIDLLNYLRQHETLARTMGFMVQATREPGVPRRYAPQTSPYLVLNTLREKFPATSAGDPLEKFANLATAICVVHDRPFKRHINENLTSSPSPTELFEYYSANEKAMLFGIKNVPPELLIYVVDTTAPIDEMTWAMKKYAGDNAVGRHFFDISYDYEHFKTGKKKKVTELGFTLPNILKYGGVCADQAFFATELGKSIGVPTAYTTGESATAGHAWVGFLQERNGEGVWNFDEGRYSAYRGVKGEVLDPQARQQIPDAYVSLLAELIGTRTKKLSADDRHNSIALTDAAARLADLTGSSFTPAALEGKVEGARAAARSASVDSALELLKLAVNANRANARAWYLVATLAKDGKLSMAQKKEWRDAVLAACGTRYPDFALAILTPIIGSVDDATMQNQWWDVVFNMFQGRADLSADIRMRQAALWEKHNQPAKAGQYYEDVINRYTNAGPFVLEALAGAERLLADKPDKVLKLYEQTFAKAQKPAESAFTDQSNWYRIGLAYASRLRANNQTQKADAVATQLGAN